MAVIPTTTTDQTTGQAIIPWPDDRPPRYMGAGEPCDALSGPCCCGATHPQADDEPEGRREIEYGTPRIKQLVRAVVPSGQSAATYNVLIAAAEAAVGATTVRSDGLVYPNDVLATLCVALDAARCATVPAVPEEPRRAELDRLLRELERARLQIDDLRHQIADQEARLAHAKLWREGGNILAAWIGDRYHRVLRSIGWAPPDDETALLAQIRRDLERQR